MTKKSSPKISKITDMIGALPYRMTLAGGWIDQPFVSEFNHRPPGAMVVVSLEPTFRFMDRSGIATSTRNVAMQMWDGNLPDGDPAQLVRELYHTENRDRPAPSGSQDMAGIIYPGISRLDYDFNIDGGVFPARVESCCDPQVTKWLEEVIHVLAVAPRPEGYDPLIVKNLDPEWIGRLGQTGHDCYRAILARDTNALGAALTGTMECWKVLLPGNFIHPAIEIDLPGLLEYYQRRYPGAAYSSCGGGYLYVVSEEQVPGAFHVQIRTGAAAND